MKLDNNIFFMPLGGGQSVGASCYFLRLGHTNIIFDAGTGINNGLRLMPDLFSLEVSDFIQSLGQIDYIFISHAHMDHIGYLPMLAKSASHAKIFMTELTASLVEHQLGRKQKLLVKEMMHRVTMVSFMETKILNDIKVSFWSAGHIPGAMMVMLEYKGKTILYTGDYSTEKTPLTDGYFLPHDTKIDILIACGLHAKHPTYVRHEEYLYDKAENWFKTVERKRTHVFCQVSQLSKGIELLQVLNEKNMTRKEVIPIYVDKPIEEVIIAMERKNFSIMKSFDHPAIIKLMSEPGIIISDRKLPKFIHTAYEDRVNFALHDDYLQTEAFIKKINPAQVIWVHVAANSSEDEMLLSQAEGKDYDVLFAEDGMVYQLM